MPTSATYTYSGGRVDPAMNAGDAMASMLRVKLKASITYAAGTVLGEVTATPGTYGPYASANVDGTQNASVILTRAVTTDASGNITNANEWGAVESDVSVYTLGQFRIQDLVGLDANAVTKMGGRITEGAIGGNGIFTF